MRMFPKLFELPFKIGDFPLAIHTYGFFIAIGFIVGLWLATREAKKLGIDPKLISDLTFWILIWGLIGSRIVYIITTWDEYMADPSLFIKIHKGGLVWYGGFIGASLFTLYYSIKHKLPFFKIADILIPSVSIGHAFGRLGCFSAGCCFGKECSKDFIFAVVFKHPESIAPKGMPLYPTQLFESVGEAIIFLILVIFRTRKRFNGQVLLMYMTLYPILRSLLEILRGDKIRGFIIEPYLSTSQFISIFVIAIAIYLQIYLSKRNKEREK
jgi:phosphatidylglycerol:prolipoprotein diacylglycerol transferase